MDQSSVSQISYLTQYEAADALGVKASTLKRWKREGYGPPWTRIGRRVVYIPADVQEWIQSHRMGN